MPSIFIFLIWLSAWQIIASLPPSLSLYSTSIASPPPLSNPTFDIRLMSDTDARYRCAQYVGLTPPCNAMLCAILGREKDKNMSMLWLAVKCATLGWYWKNTHTFLAFSSDETPLRHHHDCLCAWGRVRIVHNVETKEHCASRWARDCFAQCLRSFHHLL